MDEELELLIAHSKVLYCEDLEELKDSDILHKFKGISLIRVKGIH